LDSTVDPTIERCVQADRGIRMELMIGFAVGVAVHWYWANGKYGSAWLFPK
jgi:hypothetical protein